jgi:N-methylhydantoinase A
LAEAFDIETVIVPRFPGLFSVVGLLSSDSVYEEMRMLWWGGDEGTTERLRQVFEEIEAEPRRQLAASGYQPDEILSERLVDVRFKGQGHDLHIAPEEGPNGEPLFESIHQRFLDEYERTYGFRRDGVPFIVRACRVRVRGHKESASPEIDLPQSGSPEGALKGRRPVFFRGLRDFADTPVYERRLLPIGAQISGPAIIEEVESTTVVPPQWRATIDEFGNILMTTE